MPYVAVAGFFAALVALMLLTAVSTVAAFVVACILGALLMALYFYLGRSTNLIAVHVDDAEVS